MKTFLASAILAVLVTTPCFAQQGAPTHAAEGAFVHTVFFWLKNPGNEADRTALYDGLKRLKEIEQIQRAYLGVPAPTDREVIDRSYDFSITFVFADQAAQDGYQVHPVHQKFVEDCAHLWNRVLVYDAVSPER
jgi:hypothetical protein